jgi:hypothetical protein
LIEVISGLNFYLYGRASKQLEAFHILLDRTQRFLIANSACESMEGKEKNLTRAVIIKSLVDLPPSENKKE